MIKHNSDQFKRRFDDNAENKENGLKYEAGTFFNNVVNKEKIDVPPCGMYGTLSPNTTNEPQLGDRRIIEILLIYPKNDISDEEKDEKEKALLEILMKHFNKEKRSRMLKILANRPERFDVLKIKTRHMINFSHRINTVIQSVSLQCFRTKFIYPIFLSYIRHEDEAKFMSNCLHIFGNSNFGHEKIEMSDDSGEIVINLSEYRGCMKVDDYRSSDRLIQIMSAFDPKEDVARKTKNLQRILHIEDGDLESIKGKSLDEIAEKIKKLPESSMPKAFRLLLFSVFKKYINSENDHALIEDLKNLTFLKSSKLLVIPQNLPKTLQSAEVLDKNPPDAVKNIIEILNLPINPPPLFVDGRGYRII